MSMSSYINANELPAQSTSASTPRRAAPRLFFCSSLTRPRRPDDFPLRDRDPSLHMSPSISALNCSCPFLLAHIDLRFLLVVSQLSWNVCVLQRPTPAFNA